MHFYHPNIILTYSNNITITAVIGEIDDVNTSQTRLLTTIVFPVFKSYEKVKLDMGSSKYQ